MTTRSPLRHALRALVMALPIALSSALSNALPAQIGFVVSSYHGATPASHQFSTTTLSGQGYRPISLAVAGGLANATYSAIWRQVAGPAWVASHGMTPAQYSSQRTTWQQQGYRPLIVTASGAGTDQVFAAIYVADGVTTSHSTGLSLTAFEADLAAKRAAGYRLVSCATYGSSLTPLYAPVYELVDNVAWGAEVNDTGNAYATHVGAYADGETRPAFLAMTDAQRYLSVWHDDRIGGWTTVADRTSAQFAADRQSMEAAGLYPLCYASGGSGANLRFSGIWVERYTPYARTLTHTGTQYQSMSAFDTMMDTFVVEHRVRSAALAVVWYGKLVYARGYTYAEPGYPQTQPTSLFRIGSISKPLCGMVAHDLIEHGLGGLTLNTNMASQLGIGNPLPGIATITLQQLLTHTSGMVNAVNELDAANWWSPGNPTMPPDENVIVRYASTFPPTPAGQWKYSNAGNTAVGQMIEHAAGGQAYMNELGGRLMAPLGITRFGRQLGPKAQLLPGEVHYHLADLYVRPGNLYADLRELAPQYSQRFWDSAGGVVTSAVDLARIIAGSFQIGADSPVFSVARQNAILNRHTYPVYGNAAATQGWTDGAWGWEEHSPGNYTYWHDGAQDGFRAFCLFRKETANEIGVVALFNTDAGVSKDDIQNALDATPFVTNIDQFPNYGLPSFPRSPIIIFHSPLQVPNVSQQPITLAGGQMDEVTHATFDGTTLLPAPSIAWNGGYIEHVSESQLLVYPPQGVQTGVHTLRLFSAVGASDPRDITFVFQPNFLVAAQDYVIGGNMPFPVYATRGPLSNLSWVALGFSQSTLPSLVPGVVSLGIGNQFSDLFTSDLVPFNAITRAVRWDFPGLAGWSHVDLQAIAIDFGAPAQFPLVTTSVVTIDRH